jgi:hypothetical protein
MTSLKLFVPSYLTSNPTKQALIKIKDLTTFQFINGSFLKLCYF